MIFSDGYHAEKQRLQISLNNPTPAPALNMRKSPTLNVTVAAKLRSALVHLAERRCERCNWAEIIAVSSVMPSVDPTPNMTT